MIHLIAHYSNAKSLWKGVPALRYHVQNMSNGSELRQAVIDWYFRYSSWLWNYCTIKRKVILSNVKQKCGSLPPGSAVNLNKLNFNNWNRIVHQNALWSLVRSTTQPWNKQISAPDASQLSSQERWQVADLKDFKISYIFSLPRISTNDFHYIKGKIDQSIGINYSSVNFKWTQVFLCYQSFDTLGARNFSCPVSGFGQVSQRSMNF